MAHAAPLSGATGEGVGVITPEDGQHGPVPVLERDSGIGYRSLDENQAVDFWMSV